MSSYNDQRACYSVCWIVDARKLHGNDKQVVSPPFDVFIGPVSAVFKLMIYPRVSHDVRGGLSFKKSGGKGYIQLKCEGNVHEGLAHAIFYLSIGSGDEEQPARGPRSHNFAKVAVAGLPRLEELWDFNTVVDRDSMTFNVLLGMQPQIMASIGPGNQGGG